MREYETDYVILALIVLLVGASLFALGETITSYENAIKEKQLSLKLLIFGSGGLIVGVIWNCYFSSRWDAGFIVAFLAARKTGQRFPSGLLPFAYCAVVSGIVGQQTARKYIRTMKKSNQAL